MSANDTNGQDSIATRTERALEQYLTVLPDIGRARGAADLYLVVSQSGSEYLVDLRDGVCECPDHEHRGVRCKHLRRAAFATGEEPIPGDVLAAVDPDDQLGTHVAGGPQIAASDGGIIDASADDGGEILDDDGPEWVGPFTEYDRYGEPTGHTFVRCPECGVEVLESDIATASHRPACRFD